MNTGNATVTANCSSSKMPLILDLPISKPEIFEQEEPFEMISISETIPIMTPELNEMEEPSIVLKLNAIMNFIGNVAMLPIYLFQLVKGSLYPPRLTYEELTEGLKRIAGSLELCLAAQNKRKVLILKIKEKIENISNNPIEDPLTVSQKEQMTDSLKLIENRLADETDELFLKMEDILHTMLNQINLYFPANKELCTSLKENLKLCDLYVAENMAIKTICAEANAFLDRTLSQDSRFQDKESNIEDIGFMDKKNTETP